MDSVTESIVRIGILLVLAAAFGFLAKKTCQSFIIAYLCTGLFAGPLALDLFRGQRELFDVFSQLGVVLLLFVIGLSLNVTHLKKIGRISLVSGVGQFLFTAILGTAILLVLDFSLVHSFYLAIAITFSSTIIITKLLSEKKHADSLYGRHTIGLMIVQDIIAIMVMVLLTAQTTGTFFSSFTFFAVKGSILVASVFFLSRVVLPKLLAYVAQSQEFLFVFSLAWCFGITAIAAVTGLSMEIGAIIAGLSLGSSVYQPEITARTRPLRDFFLVIFFMLLGSQMTPMNLTEVIVPATIISAFILIGNPLILYLLFRTMKFTRKNSFLAGITAAQVSEFGFVIMMVGQKQGIVRDYDMAVFTLVALFTIFVSSYLVMHSERIFTFLEPLLSLRKKDSFIQKEDVKKIYDVWVVGYHRIGWKICAMLKKQHMPFAVVDFDPIVIAELQKARTPAFFGDANDIEFLSQIGIEHAKLVISTIPDPEHQIMMIRFVRHHNKKAFIFANAPEAKYLHALYAAGANYVMTPHLLGGGWIAKLIEQGKITQKDVAQLRKEQNLEIALGLPVEQL